MNHLHKKLKSSNVKQKQKQVDVMYLQPPSRMEDGAPVEEHPGVDDRGRSDSIFL